MSEIKVTSTIEIEGQEYSLACKFPEEHLDTPELKDKVYSLLNVLNRGTKNGLEYGIYKQ